MCIRDRSHSHAYRSNSTPLLDTVKQPRIAVEVSSGGTETTGGEVNERSSDRKGVQVEVGDGDSGEEGGGVGGAQDEDGGEGEEKGEAGPKASLPQCYSSPAADPSEGAWRKCEHGADDSPTDMFNWSFSDREFGRAPG